MRDFYQRLVLWLTAQRKAIANRLDPRPEQGISIGQIVLALTNESVAREVAKVAPAGARVLLAGVLLESSTGSADPFFSPQDVRDEAEAALRCEGIVRELRARRQFDEAAEWSITAKRHRVRGARIALLLSDADKALVHQQIHGGPLQPPPRTAIEVVKS